MAISGPIGLSGSSAAGRPVQAVALALVAQDLLRVMRHPRLIAHLGSIFALRINQVLQHVEVYSSFAPIRRYTNSFSPGRGVEYPSLVLF